jgi:hypothetical protein
MLQLANIKDDFIVGRRKALRPYVISNTPHLPINHSHANI